MYSYKQFIVTLILVVTHFAYASDISYDQQNITPQTWQEVDLSYVHKINDKDYTEQANLLRPVSWVKQNHLDKIGATVHLTRDQVGEDVDVKVIAIKPTKLNYSNNASGTNKPVISTFIKHSNDVWDYTFKDQKDNTETIEATSNHPFYSLDRQDYVPIGHIRIGEHLKAKNGNETVLLSKLKHNKGVETVYNFEVYQAHNYQVGGMGILVHNICDLPEDKLRQIKEYTSDPLFFKIGDKVSAELFAKNDRVFEFRMSFKDNTWKFETSFKSRIKDIYANEITHYLVNEAHNEYPDLVTLTPNKFIRGGIVNRPTLDILAQLYPHPDPKDFTETFLEHTPNGKHTLRVANDFNLEVTSARFIGVEADLSHTLATLDGSSIEVFLEPKQATPFHP